MWWQILRFAVPTLATWVMFMSQVAPSDALTNLGKWWELTGQPVPPWLLAPRVDRIAFWFAALTLAIWIALFVRRRRSPAASQTVADHNTIAEALLEMQELRKRSSASVSHYQNQPSNAEQAAEEYSLRSIPHYKQTIEAELMEVCERVAARFDLPGWPRPGEVTQRIAAKVGEPDDFIRTQPDDTVWTAVQVLVAFEARRTRQTLVRPTFTSYVMLGRVAPGKNVVGVCDDSRRWQVLAEGAPTDPSHFNVMVEAAESERGRLLAQLELEIRRLTHEGK
jgi:hypothetical protein